MSTNKLVYVAGAIDYAQEDAHLQRGAAHDDSLWPAGVERFCPKCENQYEADVYELMGRNWGAVARCDALVAFVNTDTFSFGVPVEIWERAKTAPRTVVIVHQGTKQPGAFVQWLRLQGVIVIDDEVVGSGVDFPVLLKSAVAEALGGGQ